jgi:putative membrane protein
MTMKRALLLVSGLVTLAAAWFTDLPSVLPGPFSQHMSVHMAVVAVAAPLLTFAVAGTRFDPVRVAPRLFPAVPISVVELVVVWLWHAPRLHHFARHSTAGLVLEQGTFLLSGLLVWLASFGGARHAREDRLGAGVLALLLTSMHMTLLGALLALPPRPLYEHAAHPDQGAQGHGGHTVAIDALADQHLGGAIMLLVGGISYLFGGLWLTAQLLRRWAPSGARRS